MSYLWADISFFMATTVLNLIGIQTGVSRSYPRTTEFLLPCLRPWLCPIGSTTLPEALSNFEYGKASSTSSPDSDLWLLAALHH